MTKDPTKIQFVVPPQLAGARVDKAIATIPQIGSRSQAAKLIQMGAVRKPDGRVVKASHEVAADDILHLEIPFHAANDRLEPYDFKLDIQFEDDDLIVVNKPAGLVVHPAAGHQQDTLVNALIHYTDDLSLGFHENRPGLVHRIDKDTSGLLVIAKNDQAQRFLAQQFARKTAHRVYYAIAFGEFKSQKGTLQSSLIRHPIDRKKFASAERLPPDVATPLRENEHRISKSKTIQQIANTGPESPPGFNQFAHLGPDDEEPHFHHFETDDDISDESESSGYGRNIKKSKPDLSQIGKRAVTHFEVQKFHPSGLSLVKLQLETGRTHQIRVHLSEFGHPIVGDSTYGAERRVKNLKSTQLRLVIESMNRFALHAGELGFIHPTTKKEVRFKVGWPEDLLALVRICEFEK